MRRNEVYSNERVEKILTLAKDLNEKLENGIENSEIEKQIEELAKLIEINDYDYYRFYKQCFYRYMYIIVKHIIDYFGKDTGKQKNKVYIISKIKNMIDCILQHIDYRIDTNNKIILFKDKKF